MEPVKFFRLRLRLLVVVFFGAAPAPGFFFKPAPAPQHWLKILTFVPKSSLLLHFLKLNRAILLQEQMTAPYIPGFLAFREAGFLCDLGNIINK